MYSNRECFFAQTQTQIQTWGRGRSEASDAAWHTFDLLDYTNMLIHEGTMEYL